MKNFFFRATHTHTDTSCSHINTQTHPSIQFAVGGADRGNGWLQHSKTYQLQLCQKFFPLIS